MTKLDILKRLSPGTGLRKGLDDIIRGNDGALIVVGNPASLNIFEGGFRVNCKFTPQRLAELAKMDGAIILSEDFKKILFVNTLLVPDRTISTTETGTRHQAAERTAKQIEGLVIAVSERRNKIMVFYKNSKYTLRSSEELLRRATETLQILEKQREIFDELLSSMNVLEITGLVSTTDVGNILQKIEMIRKMADIINEYIVGLGKEGIIVRMRMREIKKGIDGVYDFILKDYNLNVKKVCQFFDELSFEELLEKENIAKFLFGANVETKIIPIGYRILNKTKLNKKEIESLVGKFDNLEKILDSEDEELKNVLSDVGGFKKEISNLREQIMLGKKI